MDMKTTYDKEADAAYIYVRHPIKPGESKKTIELDKDIIIDLDKDGRLLGVEILNAKKILSKKALQSAVQLSA